MKALKTEIKDLVIIEPEFFGDERGFFFESYNQKKLKECAGIDADFVQDNHSRSARHVLRGLHYQLKNPQGKLVRVVSGEVFDVAVDLRRNSKTFGKWVGFHLSSQNRRILFVPAGFAHGFLVLSESADFLYKTTSFYDPASERCIKWDDADLKIEWPLDGNMPLLSAKDAKGNPFKCAEGFA
jgi:dTDP-4-dehydrorhamnose 3,5-epimerase